MTASLIQIVAILALQLALPPNGGEPRSGSAAALANRLFTASAAERAVLLERPEFTSPEIVGALMAMGQKYQDRAEVFRAFPYFDLAVTVARRAQLDRELGRALLAAADTQVVGDDSVRRAEESIAIHQRLGDRDRVAQAWNNIGHVRWRQSRYGDAIAAYEEAGREWTAAGNDRGVARSLNNIANCELDRGNFDGALERYQGALAVMEKVGDRRSVSVILVNIGGVHLPRGEYSEALDYTERGLEISRQIGSEYDTAMAYIQLGLIHRARGAYARALHYLHDALEVIRAHNYGQPQMAQVSINIGLVHYSQGDYPLAIDWYKRSLRHNNAETPNTRVAAQLLFNIGAAARRLGERQRADANYRESFAISEREHYPDLGSAILIERGLLALDRGRPAEGRRLIAQALERNEGFKDQAGAAEALIGLARIELSLERPEKAIEFSRRAEAITAAIDHRDMRSEAHTLTGMAYRRLGQSGRAREALGAAIDLIEGMSAQVAAPDSGGTHFFENKVSPYHELIELAVAEQRDAEALELAERAKARALAQVLQRGRIEARAGMSADARLEEKRIRSRLLTLNQTIQAERLEAAPDRERMARLTAERDERRRELDSFLAAQYSMNPELRKLRSETAWFRLAQADRLLPDASVAILHYVVTDRFVLLFVLHRDAGDTTTLSTYRLSDDAPSIAGQSQRFRDRVASRDLAFAEDARRLYNVLVNPARDRLRGRTHLIVIADGALWDVPFHVLQDPGGRYLIDSAAISYAPSLTVLQQVLSRGNSHARRPTLLAMGKSEFGAKGQAPALRLMSDLTPLPEAERQATMIARLYGADRSSLYLGGAAQEDRFKAEAPQYSVLHLASHGLFDPTSPLYSHVVLTPGTGESSEDGLLEAWELMDLKLQAELVVLSACETGRGHVATGEGIVGPMWALLAAGARSMVVSQWKVEATSTTSLMISLHRGVASGAGARAEHLRRAVLDVKADPRFSHPFYWAPFVLVGDPF